MNAVPGFGESDWMFGRWSHVSDGVTHMAVAEESYPDNLRVDGSPPALCYQLASSSEIVCTGLGLTRPEERCGPGRLGDCAGTRIVQRTGDGVDPLHSIVAGDDYFCTIEGERRQVRCFGYHLDDHEDGDTANTVAFRGNFVVDMDNAVIQDVAFVGAARTTTCLVHGSSREVCCVGRRLGQAEAGSPSCRPIGSLSDVTAMASGLSNAPPAPQPAADQSDHFCFVFGDSGEIRCIGGGNEGQARPFHVGFDHVCSLYGQVVSPFLGSSDGDLLGCEASEAAIPPSDPGLSPPPADGFAHVTAGRAATCASRSNDVWCWGDEGLAGPEGLRRLTFPTTPRLMEAGLQHACAVTEDNELHCWGNPEAPTGLELMPGRAVCQTTPLSTCE